MEMDVRTGWLLTIDALRKGVAKEGYLTIAEGWTMLMESGYVDPEEASNALYELEQQGFVLVESDEEYDGFMHEYFPTKIELTEDGTKLIRELTRHPVLTVFIEGLTSANQIVQEIKDATPAIREAIKGVVNIFFRK